MMEVMETAIAAEQTFSSKGIEVAAAPIAGRLPPPDWGRCNPAWPPVIIVVGTVVVVRAVVGGVIVRRVSGWRIAQRRNLVTLCGHVGRRSGGRRRWCHRSLRSLSGRGSVAGRSRIGGLGLSLISLAGRVVGFNESRLPPNDSAHLRQAVFDAVLELRFVRFHIIPGAQLAGGMADKCIRGCELTRQGDGG